MSAEERLERLENALIAYIRMHERDPAFFATNPADQAYAEIVRDFVNEVLGERETAPDF